MKKFAKRKKQSQRRAQSSAPLRQPARHSYTQNKNKKFKNRG